MVMYFIVFLFRPKFLFPSLPPLLSHMLLTYWCPICPQLLPDALNRVFILRISEVNMTDLAPVVNPNLQPLFPYPIGPVQIHIIIWQHFVQRIVGKHIRSNHWSSPFNVWGFLFNPNWVQPMTSMVTCWHCRVYSSPSGSF